MTEACSSAFFQLTCNWHCKSIWQCFLIKHDIRALQKLLEAVFETTLIKQLQKNLAVQLLNITSSFLSMPNIIVITKDA